MKNINGLQEYSKQRNKETFEKVNKAITSLKRSNKKITIAAVAKKANVAVATIYNNPELKERITQLKEIPNVNVSTNCKKPLNSVKTQSSTKIEEFKRRNRELREKIENLEIDKGLLLGQLKDLATENLELKSALEQYRKVINIK